MKIPERRAIRRYLPLLAVAAIGVGGFVWSSCQDDVNPLTPSDVVFPDSVSYGQHVEVLFQHSCVAARCHGATQAGGGLDLESPSYRALIDHQPQLVLVGDGAHSLLVLRITGAVGTPMPPPTWPALTDNQVAGIKRWIDQGAINN